MLMRGLASNLSAACLSIFTTSSFSFTLPPFQETFYYTGDRPNPIGLNALKLVCGVGDVRNCLVIYVAHHTVNYVGGLCLIFEHGVVPIPPVPELCPAVELF